MRIRRVWVASLLLIAAACSSVSDDPFTATWRRVESANDAASSKPFILSPVEGGISFQQGDSEPTLAYYGEDSVSSAGGVWNIVRIDDHSLKSTVHSVGSETVINETAIVSRDGKRFTRTQTVAGNMPYGVIEYERVGPVPSGDAFFGTWRLIPETITIKVSQGTLNLTQTGQPDVSVKLDGNEYAGPVENSKIEAKRIDAKTIEVQFDEPVGGEQSILLNINGDKLTLTSTRDNDGAQGTSPGIPVIEFERVK